MDATLVVKETTVLTMDEQLPEAQGFATFDDKFIVVGSNEEITTHEGPNTQVITLPEKTVVPGFYDAHCHMTSRGLDLLKVDLRPEQVSTIDEIVDKIAEESAETPSNDWILGSRYDDTKLAEGRDPTRYELDEATTAHPVFILHCGAHHGVINSTALEIAGWNETVPDELEPYIERDSRTGEPSGVIHEDAKDQIRGSRDVSGLIPDPTPEEEQEGLKLACERYNSMGITSVADMSGTPSSIRMYTKGAERNDLSVRVTTVVRPPYWEKLNDLSISTGFGDDMLKLGPLKSTIDGAIAARTARLSEPYEGRPDDYGKLRKTQEEIDELVMRGHESGYQVALHANGDETIRMVLRSFRKALKERPKDDHRHRIEHCTVVDDELLEEIAELNLVVNPFSTYLYQHGDKMGEYGDRVEMMFAHGSFLEHGIPVSGTTDNPAGLLPPLLGIRTMVTRETREGEVLGSNQRIDVEDALRIYTKGSAYSTFDEESRGSISPGKLADFVVLSGDPTQVEKDRIHEIDVEQTFVGGERVYSR